MIVDAGPRADPPHPPETLTENNWEDSRGNLPGHPVTPGDPEADI